MNEVFNWTIYYLKQIIESSYIYLLFLISIIWLYFKNKTNSQRVFFLWGSLFSLFLILCPLSGKVLFLGLHNGTYYRNFWLIPLVPLLCYTGTDMLSHLKNRKRLFLFLIILLGITQCGTYMLREPNFHKVTNFYKLPQESIDTADWIPDGAHVVGSNWLTPYIRQYNPTITLVNDRWQLSEIDAELAKDHPDLAVLGPMLQNSSCDFVAIGQDLNLTIIGKWEDYGFHFYRGDNRCIIFINENSSFYNGEP